MKKLKLLLAFCALLLGWSNAMAKTDVTSTYLTDAALEDEAVNWALTNSGGNHNWNSTHKYHESWHNTFSLSQTVTIPNGYYQISIQAVNSVSGETAKLTATSGDNSASAYIRHSSAGSFAEISERFASNPLACRIYATVKVDNGSLTVGFSQTNAAQWIVYGQFKLYSLTEAEYNNAIALQTSIESNANYWSDGWTNGGNQYSFGRERFNETAYGAGKIIYKTFTDLPTGKYDVTVMARANVAWREAATGPNIAEVYANEGKYSLTVNAETGFIPSSTYNYTLENVMVSDGNLEVGIRNIATGGNWYVISLVNLLYKGEDLADYETPLANAKAAAAAVNQETPMNATVLSALQTAITNYGSKPFGDYTTVSEIQTAINALNTAANNATTSISNYEGALSILNAASTLDAAGQASYAANETVAGIQLAYNDRSLESVSSAQQTACAAALRTAAKAQTTEGADMTLAIENWDFTNCANDNFPGWTITKDGGNSWVHGATCVEYWKEKAAEASFDYYQIIKGLPDGKYTISASMWNSANSEEGAAVNGNAGVYGTNGIDVTVFKGVDSESTDVSLVTKVTDQITVLDGTLRIGVKNNGTMGARWFGVDWIKLTYVGAATAKDCKEFLSSAISAATDARKTANEGTGAFQIPAAAGTTLAGAITDAQNVYDNGAATVSEIKTAIPTLKTAIGTYEATELNAPAAGTRYYLTVATSGHAKENNAIVVTLGATSNNNKTGYGFAAAAEPKTYMAQALIFTQVSENNYKISVERPEGMVYLTYGSLNNSAAGWATQQIQGTTDASAAGEFKIVATATANVFNIYNTVYNDYIDCQDGGSLYTDTNIDMKDFTLSEASQASVDIKIDANVKYATRIFPFVPELPSGVKAYSCAASEGNELTLVEVVSPAANVPYILEAESGCNETLQGWGTAGATSYTTGWLTGVYESTTATAGTYVLQNNDDKVAFYLVEENEEPTVGAYRCYLTKSAGARAAFFFPGSITGVNNVAAAAAEAEVKDGKYIENGKVVIVKNGKKFSATGAQMK